MKVAIIADSHFDATSRFDECVRLHDWIADDIAARDVDLVLHAGDVYERQSTPRERAAVADWVQRVTALAPMVIVRGNHDAVGDLALLERLETREVLHVVEDARVIPVGGALVACLAWPRKAELAAAGADAGDALRAVLRGLGAELAEHPGPRILLAHAMVTGSVTSTGQPLVGHDLELGLADLGLARADLYALGHIHRGQSWTWDGAPVVYPGSPRRTAFGETEAKGYVVATFDGHRCTTEFVEVPATPMVHLETEWAPEHVGLPGDVVVPAGFCDDLDEPTRGAEVRLRYHVAPDRRDAARAAAEQWRARALADGAVSVKVEEVVEAEVRARAPEVAAAPTLDEKLAALWAARGIQLDDVRRARVLEHLHSIEAA